jgi:ER-bound oxygenase mpaB/B'/Rubber oxygenase, catalytic domain
MNMTAETKRGSATNPRHLSEIERLYYGRHRMAFRIGTYLALIRMMGIAHLVGALYGHTKLVSETHDRLARTRQTVVDLIRHGFDSSEGKAAIQRLRDAHRNLKASPADYRYVLATFFLEPLRWSAQHGSKILTQNETDLLLKFWMRVGDEMGIPDLPASLQEWKTFQQDFEARCMRSTPEGHRLALMCLRDVVKLSLPRGTQGIFRQIMIATLEPVVRQCLGIAAPHWPARLSAWLVLRIMA